MRAMSDSQPTVEPRLERFPAMVLYGWFVRFLAILMLIAVWAGHFFLQRTWPAPFKLWLCTALGVAAILRSIFRRGPGLRTVAPSGVTPVISPFQAFVVVAILVAGSVFFTWVAFGPPH